MDQVFSALIYGLHVLCLGHKSKKEKGGSITYCVELEKEVNPLNLKSDKHPISPYNITPESHIKVMRMKEMITREGTFWLANKFSLSAPRKCIKNSATNNMFTDVRV